MTKLPRKPTRKHRRTAPAPRILGPPEDPDGDCDLCGEPAELRVRTYTAFDIRGEPYAMGSDTWDRPQDWDLCEVCYQIEKRIAASHDGGMEFTETWPGYDGIEIEAEED